MLPSLLLSNRHILPSHRLSHRYSHLDAIADGLIEENMKVCFGDWVEGSVLCYCWEPQVEAERNWKHWCVQITSTFDLESGLVPHMTASSADG